MKETNHAMNVPYEMLAKCCYYEALFELFSTELLNRTKDDINVYVL